MSEAGSTSPSRVLLVRAGALGDLLLLRTTIATLRAAGTFVGLVAPPAGDVLLGDGLGEVQEHLRWDDPGFARLANGELVSVEHEADPRVCAQIRRLGSYQAAIAYTSSESFLAALRHLIPKVQAISPTALEPGVAAARALAGPALVVLTAGPEAVEGEVPVEPAALVPRPEDEDAAASWLRQLPEGFLAIHPGSGSVRKNWPAARFGALADRLAPDLPFLIVEGPADAAAVAPFRGSRAVVAKDLPLRVLGALLRRAGLFVGNDSGVSHLAAAFAAPTLVLFGPTPAAVWTPVGPQVRPLEAPEGSLDALDVETVARAANEALRSWGRPGLP